MKKLLLKMILTATKLVKLRSESRLVTAACYR
jgi:hypothetical protein